MLARLPVGEHLAIELRQGADDDRVLISRMSTRVPGDYLEQTAIAVGTYYRDFAVGASPWRQAVHRVLDGLAIAFAGTVTSSPDAESSDLAGWLLARHERLT